MLSPTEKFSEHISDIFGAVGATGIISSEDYHTLKIASHHPGLEQHERKSIHRLLRAVQRGKVHVIAGSVAC